MRRIYLVLLIVVLSSLACEGRLAAQQKPVIYFGVIPRYNPMLMYRSYQPLMDYLSENTPYRFELKLARDYPEAVDLLRRGVVEIASLGDVTFAEARMGFGAIPILKPLNAEGTPYYRSIIIVRDDSSIQTIADLRGKSVAFGDLHSTSGNLIPRDYLFRNGISLFDLGSYENLESHDAVAKAVLKGKVDAGAVKDVMAIRYREHGLKFIGQSELIPSVPIVVRQDTPAELISAIKQALLSIDPNDPVQRERMSQWDPEFRNGFVEASDEDYVPIYRLMESIKSGCGQRCH
jgi:phosphonate transport system substrate-binding protein